MKILSGLSIRAYYAGFDIDETDGSWVFHPRGSARMRGLDEVHAPLFANSRTFTSLEACEDFLGLVESEVS